MSDIMTDEQGNELPGSGVWGKFLAGLTPAQIARGLEACKQRHNQFPPNALEFRDLCMAGENGLGIPDVSAAWREACEASSDPTTFKFSHQIVHEAGRLTDWYSIRTGTPKAETVQKRFEKRYQQLTDKLANGKQLVDDQLLLGREKAMDALAAADAHADDLQRKLMASQGVEKTTPQKALQDLRAKLKGRRHET